MIAPEVEAVAFMRDLAAGELDEAGLARWIAADVGRLDSDSGLAA